MPWRCGALARVRALLLGASSLLATGCFSAPSPLAPGLKGSIGLPHQGVLTQASPLPAEGEGFRRLRRDEIRWGNPRLVDAIQSAAAEVRRTRPGGAALVVGDLSPRLGGQASGHRSHRTGRDADLLFYATDLQGRSVPCPGFVRFGADGLASLGEGESGPFVRLDVGRTWRLVKALVTDPQAQVQWLFAARWLEALLLEEGKALGEDPELLWYAESVLQQPGDSKAHDDHLHLRIGCSAEETVGGCSSGGPQWPWLERGSPAPVPTEAELVAALLGQTTPSP